MKSDIIFLCLSHCHNWIKEAETFVIDNHHFRNCFVSCAYRKFNLCDTRCPAYKNKIPIDETINQKN